jgi:hypothetical protein
MAATEIARIISEPEPLRGQRHRSSENFSTESIPDGATYLSFTVQGGGTNVDRITFDIMQDISGGEDPVIYPGESNGSQSPNVTKYPALYIANPKGAVSNFEVIVYANR